MDSHFRGGMGAVLASLVVVSPGCERDESQINEQGNAAQFETVRGAMSSHNPRVIRIENVDAIGSGCPDLDASSIEIAPDGQSLVVHFKELNAGVERGEAIKRAQCTIGVSLQVSPGYTYSVSRLDSSGYVVLRASGMEARFSSSYFFQGDRVNTSRANDVVWNTQIDTDFQVQPSFSDTSTWSQCGVNRKLYIDLAVQVNNNGFNSGTGYIEAKTLSRVGFSWRQCSP